MVSFGPALLLIVPAVLSVLAYRYNLHAEQQPQDWKVTADRIRLSDGRHIAYEVVGSRESSNPIFWFHGLASSRSVAAHGPAVYPALSPLLIGRLQSCDFPILPFVCTVRPFAKL